MAADPQSAPKVKSCRACHTPLTVENARRSRGRWVGICRPCENAESCARQRMTHGERKAERNARHVSLVREAIDRWRLQNDPAPDLEISLPEFIVRVLEDQGRLR